MGRRRCGCAEAPSGPAGCSCVMMVVLSAQHPQGPHWLGGWVGCRHGCSTVELRRVYLRAAAATNGGGGDLAAADWKMQGTVCANQRGEQKHHNCMLLKAVRHYNSRLDTDPPFPPRVPTARPSVVCVKAPRMIATVPGVGGVVRAMCEPSGSCRVSHQGCRVENKGQPCERM